MKGRVFFNYSYQLARTKRFTGKLNDSEEILRDLLMHHENLMNATTKTILITQLAEILFETDRLEESTEWFERELIILLENAGLQSPMTKASCKKVGFCYAELGRYDEATLHFERMIERIVSEDPQSIHNPERYVQDINRWISEVDEMRDEALGAE